MRRYATLLLISAGFISTPALAAGCDTPNTGFDNVYCFAKVYMDLDRQLNDSYVLLMHTLPADKKQALREGQRGWIDMRNHKCLRSEGNNNSVNINCALATTRRRIQFLSDRLAECRGTHCNMSILGRVEE